MTDRKNFSNTYPTLKNRIEEIGLELRENIPLSDHTTFKIGGPAQFFVAPSDTEKLIDVIRLSHTLNIPHFLLGGGSNILVRENGIQGLVIKDLTCGCEVDRDARTLTVKSGEPLADMVYKLCSAGISGIEFLAGIPGTVGGAVSGNAGAYGLSIADILKTARVLQDGEVTEIGPEDMEYEYRNSRIKKSVKNGHFPELVVLEVVFNITFADDGSPLKKVEEYIEHRKGRLPDRNTGCAGSYFKNLPPLPGETRRRAAGMLLDQAGAKSLSSGGAQVFKDHANVIINGGNATASDVLSLAEKMKKLIRDKHHIELEAEVMTVGD